MPSRDGELWHVATDDNAPAGADGEFFRGKIQVTLPSDIWITYQEAREFGQALIEMAAVQEQINKGRIDG